MQAVVCGKHREIGLAAAVIAAIVTAAGESPQPEAVASSSERGGPMNESDMLVDVADPRQLRRDDEDEERSGYVISTLDAVNDDDVFGTCCEKRDKSRQGRGWLVWENQACGLHEFARVLQCCQMLGDTFASDRFFKHDGVVNFLSNGICNIPIRIFNVIHLIIQ